ALAYNPAHFTNRPFSFVLSIRDKESGVLGAATFTGVFNGTLSRTSSNLHVRFTSPLTRFLHLGHDLYYISVGQVTLGTPRGATRAGRPAASGPSSGPGPPPTPRACCWRPSPSPPPACPAAAAGRPAPPERPRTPPFPPSLLRDRPLPTLPGQRRPGPLPR